MYVWDICMGCMGRIYVCMYIRMYVCMYVLMYVCMYVYACMYAPYEFVNVFTFTSHRIIYFTKHRRHIHHNNKATF